MKLQKPITLPKPIDACREVSSIGLCDNNQHISFTLYLCLESLVLLLQLHNTVPIAAIVGGRRQGLLLPDPTLLLLHPQVELLHPQGLPAKKEEKNREGM